MEDVDRTIYCGNLSVKITEEILYELFLQAAPIERVKIPLDKDGRAAAYAFVTFKHAVSVPYAIDLLNGIELYQKKLILKPRNGTQQQSNGLENRLSALKLPRPDFLNDAPRKRFDNAPVMPRRVYNHNYDRRNDKPYGQVYRNRNNRHDYDNNRPNHTNSYYRRH